MPDDFVTEDQVKKMMQEVPDVIREFKSRNRPANIKDLFPGDENEHIREALMKKGFANIKGQRVGAIMDDNGLVFGMAAKISRKPDRSYEYVKDIKDFTEDTGNPREDKIPFWYRIARQEGIINNGINKTAALVSSNGNFYVRRARQGRRKISNVEEELALALDFWKRNVNARGVDGPITGARGLASIINQGTRQALIEGSWVAYMHEDTVDVPSAGKSFTLPMFLQSLSTQYVTIPDGLVGTGLERFFWEPPREIIQEIVDSPDEAAKEAFEEAFSSEFVSELEAEGKVELDPSRILHVKHRGVEFEPFGESFLEPLVADIAYKRALQALDFVTIESMINRLMIIKVGDENPDSDFHNLEFAQKRLQVLQNMFDTVDPNMTILWAGPDIDVLDVGVHGKVAELDGRYQIAHDRIIMSMGIPKALLTGADANSQVWASYEGYKETLRAMQWDFAHSAVSIGERIAANNGFEGVELNFEFDRSVLADQTANADLALRTRKAGLSSIRRTIGELGGDYESERRNRILERGLDPDSDSVPSDEELFSPPAGMPGDTRVNEDGNVRDPGGEPGRPPDSQREDLGPERDRENRNPRDGE